MTRATDRAQITRTMLDYFEGWFDADVTRMDRALHPELVKRSPAEGLGMILTKGQMLEFTAEGDGIKVAADRRLDVTIEDVYEDMASVTVRSAPYYEYHHLVRTGEGWKIAQALYRVR